MTIPITVAIPLGPEPHYADFLDECLESVWSQTHKPDEVLIIDDMHGVVLEPRPDLRVWRSPWRLGVAHAFNFGVALSKHELVFMLGADDRLLPDCLEKCIRTYEQFGKQDGYYAVPVAYSDGREQNVPCNAAMVTKGFWTRTGGFPVEAASGAPDAALMSILLGNSDAGKIVMVGSKPLYWYRVHGNTDTAGRQPWQGVILQTRDLVTRLWKQPMWGRACE